MKLKKYTRNLIVGTENLLNTINNEVPLGERHEALIYVFTRLTAGLKEVEVIKIGEIDCCYVGEVKENA